MDNLEVFLIFQAVYFTIVSGTIDLLWVHVTSNTEPASPRELYEISANAAESVKNIAWSLRLSITACVLNSAGDMLSHRLWCDRVPRLIVNLDSSVELAEQEVPFIPKSF